MNNFTRNTIHSSLEKHEKRAHLAGELAAMISADTISIKVRGISGLYSEFDPDPLETRLLSPDVEQFIMEELQHFRSNSGISIRIVADDTEGVSEETVQKSFENHFRTRAEEHLIVSSKERRHWLWNLLFGALFLALCLVAAHLLNVRSEQVPFLSVLSESLCIVGWVALWEPAGYFLYGRQEGARTLRRYMRLHRAAVSVTASPGTAG